MSAAAAFATAAERGDLDGMVATLAPDVVFHSPVTFHPFLGRETVGRLLGVVLQTFEDFRYVGELAGRSEGLGAHALRFRARVGEREIEGVDLIVAGEDDLISDFTVMLRPMSATVAFAQLMGPRLEAAGIAPTRPA